MNKQTCSESEICKYEGQKDDLTLIMGPLEQVWHAFLAFSFLI